MLGGNAPTIGRPPDHSPSTLWPRWCTGDIPNVFRPYWHEALLIFNNTREYLSGSLNPQRLPTLYDKMFIWTKSVHAYIVRVQKLYVYNCAGKGTPAPAAS